MCRNTGLEPFDALVYTTIKRYMNKDTNEAFPSIETIRGHLECKKSAVIDSINKLRGKYLATYRNGNKQVYTFPYRYSKYEPFSYEFLDKKELTPQEKAYVIAVQQYMFKNVKGYGKVSFTTGELAMLINMPEWKIRKLDRSLQEKGYLSVVKLKSRDFVTGRNRTERIFDMKLIGQQLIWRLFRNNELIEQKEKELHRLQQALRAAVKILENRDKAAAVKCSDVTVDLEE